MNRKLLQFYSMSDPVPHLVGKMLAYIPLYPSIESRPLLYHCLRNDKTTDAHAYLVGLEAHFIRQGAIEGDGRFLKMQSVHNTRLHSSICMHAFRVDKVTISCAHRLGEKHNEYIDTVKLKLLL